MMHSPIKYDSKNEIDDSTTEAEIRLQPPNIIEIMESDALRSILTDQDWLLPSKPLKMDMKKFLIEQEVHDRAIIGSVS